MFSGRRIDRPNDDHIVRRPLDPLVHPPARSIILQSCLRSSFSSVRAMIAEAYANTNPRAYAYPHTVLRRVCIHVPRTRLSTRSLSSSILRLGRNIERTLHAPTYRSLPPCQKLTRREDEEEEASFLSPRSSARGRRTFRAFFVGEGKEGSQAGLREEET